MNKMSKMKLYNKRSLALLTLLLLLTSCVPKVSLRKVNKNTPETYYNNIKDSTNIADLKYKDFFQDDTLITLIDSALKNNQELNIVLNEILIAKNEIRERKGEYLPFLNLGTSTGFEKVGRFTREGAVEHNLEIAPDKEFPEPLSDLMLSANVSWEIDVWKKLRNAKKSAMYRYLASIEGKNFLITQLVSEISHTYYELMAVKNEVELVKRTIQLQENALKVIRQQKKAARATELAVKRFEAEIAKNKSILALLQQQIIETENKLNFLLGQFPKTIPQTHQKFMSLSFDSILIKAGSPAELLKNRPDIRQAEMELQAAKLDVAVARASFYPRFELLAGIGTQAFSPGKLILFPESFIYSMFLETLTPLANRNGLKARFYIANNKQMQAIINYERTVLNAYIEVSNLLAKIRNIRRSYEQKQQQVNALNRSVRVVINLFRYARADYLEVLLAQREALEAQRELVELKLAEINAVIDLYRALGGGWK